MYQYVHGGDIYSDPSLKQNKEMLDYSANINPLGIPAGVARALKNAVTDCVNYPDPFCRELRAGLSRYFSLPAEMIYCGNGAADVLVLCNPNNPTGKLMDKELLLRVLRHCEELHIPLLVDECFMDFVKDEDKYSLVDQVAGHPKLIILKAFTKIFAIPGVRLGFCLTSDAALMDKLYACGQDWNVSVLAQAAGVAALDETDYLEETRELIAVEKAYLVAQLRLIKLQVFEGAANYLLIKTTHNYPWPEKLKKHHILIRDCSNFRGLSAGYYRIAVKTRRDNRKLIKIMKELVKHDMFNYIN